MPKNYAIYFVGLAIAVCGSFLTGAALANFSLGCGIGVLGVGLALILKS
jgi:hypothetical protein